MNWLPILTTAVCLGMAVPQAPGARADEAVALELVLAVDTSASVDPDEFDLQVSGLANAFRDTQVLAAIEATLPLGIVVTVAQWAGPYSQDVTVPWHVVRSRADALALADLIEAGERVFLIDVTAVGEAVIYSAGLIASSGYAGARRIIDVSGDGPSNFGLAPQAARDHAVAAGITVNGLVILNGQTITYDHYRDHVIGGVGSFLVAADDFHAYAAAIRTKLVREISDAPVALEAPPPVISPAAAAPD
jgi:hypothetical protein